MAYLVNPIDTPIVYVDDSLVAQYVAAGWTQASAAQIAAYHARDPYAGRQFAPPAPPIVGGKVPNTDPHHIH